MSRRRVAATVLGLGLIMAPGMSRAQDRVVAPGARLEKLAGDFTFTEGPTCDAEGNLFFTDQPNDRILKWSVEGRLSTFLQPAGRLTRKTLVAEQGSDGMTLDTEGNLYLTGNGVLVFDKAGRQVEQIQVPGEGWTANVSFCGKDNRRSSSRQARACTASKCA